jgi:hypothetical protein
MPPKKQKLTPTKADVSLPSTPVASSPLSDPNALPNPTSSSSTTATASLGSAAASVRSRPPPSKSPKSPPSPGLKRARGNEVESRSLPNNLPAAAARSPAGDAHNQNSNKMVVASSASAADAGGGGGGVKKKHFPFIYGNYSGYYGYRSPSVEDARLKMLSRSMFEGKRCLDIGCNAGELTAAIAHRYAPQHILGVDIDGSLVRSVLCCL